jgi:transcriptional regulator with XRE-family HTH domain
MTQIDNILSIKYAILERFRNVRRVAKLSQIALAERSGVSLGSIKRFERTGEISFVSLLKLAMALGYESDFNNLFTRKNYQSIFDVVKDGGNDAK